MNNAPALRQQTRAGDRPTPSDRAWSQADDIALSAQVMLDWLDSIGRRDSQPGLTS